MGLLLVGIVGLLAPKATSAGFTDSVRVTGGVLAASSVPETELSCAPLDLVTVRMTWTSIPDVSGYRFHYGVDGAEQVTLGAGTTQWDLPATNVLGSAWVVGLRSFGDVTWESLPSNVKTYLQILVATCGDG